MLGTLPSALLLVLCALPAAAAPAATGVKQPPLEGGSTLYVSNRAPLAPSPLIKLPVGSIIPRGWLRHELELEANGMTGHLEEISPWCKFDGNAWTDARGEGKNGWEEVPYWIKGFGDLGYVLRDDRIISHTRKWLVAIFAAQQQDGWFGPVGLKTALKGKPDLWPHMPVLNAMQSWYEFSDDKRVLALMSRYFKWELAAPDAEIFTGYWDRMRTGDNLESVYWLYNRTGEKWLLDLAEKIHRHSADWAGGIPNWHNVNVSQGFREPAEYWMQARDGKFFQATQNDYATVMDLYGQVPGGGFGGDENCRPLFHDPRQGFETCGIVEYMHSFEMLARITGDATWCDRCEDVAFNSLPAALTPDLRALHYLTAPNQVQLDKENKAPGINNAGTMFSYSPYGVYRCCQHNHGMGWPYFAEELWHATSDGGLCASLYSASEVTARVASGSSVGIVENTDYPFSDTIELKIAVQKPVEFPLYLRVPGWCEMPQVAVNGEAAAVEAQPLSFIVLSRAWANGDTVSLKLPMRTTVRTWKKNNDSVSVNYGPLTFSLKIGEKWSRYGGTGQFLEQEVYAASSWNYALVLDEQNPAGSFELVKHPGPLADQPFTPDAAPIELKARGKKVPNWVQDKRELLMPLQPSPVKTDAPVEPLTLIPMGAARLRISAFPVAGAGPDAHDWKAPPHASGLAGAAKVKASFCFGGDTVEALNDGELPTTSHDQGVPRLTFWDHKGTSEWVEYDFPAPQTVSSVDVYWFDDAGVGECRLPESWRVLYRDGDTWKPVSGATEAGIKPDCFNSVTFTPVKTSALRLEVDLRKGYSGGILEWQVK